MKNLFSPKWEKKHKASVQRTLLDYSGLIDFASNDYLGFAKDKRVQKIFQEKIQELTLQGSTGSRLISGNKKFIESIEKQIAEFHYTENALIFPSAYQANVGLFSCIADRNDLYLIDENIHASVFDGVRLSFATHYKFKHNDMDDLKNKIDKYLHAYENIFIVTEGLFSMDGDTPDVENLLSLIDNQKTFLIADEAHSFGTMGENNTGVFNTRRYAEHAAVRIIGYGKALGFSGAAIVGTNVLKNYLINFSRPFIFSTALPLYHYQIIRWLYDELIFHSEHQKMKLNQNITYYLNAIRNNKKFSANTSPIQYFLLNNLNDKNVQNFILKNNIFTKVILPPTVHKGGERIRISLHSFNNQAEIIDLIKILNNLP